jgi:hypothetical protein
MIIAPLPAHGLRNLGIIALFLIGILSITATGGGGGGSSKDQESYTDVPIQLSLENVDLNAGVPATFTYTIPVTGKPYTDVTIDLEKTMESVTLEVTPAQ